MASATSKWHQKVGGRACPARRQLCPTHPQTRLRLPSCPFEDLGLIRPPLEQRAISIEYTDLYLPGAPLPDVTQAAGLIFMGGPMSANDDLSYLRQELHLISQALARRQPVARRVPGCAVDRQGPRRPGVPATRSKEIGWFQIHLTAAARPRPVYSRASARPETVFHWHGEHSTCRRVPSGLAYSEGLPQPGIPRRPWRLRPSVPP